MTRLTGSRTLTLTLTLDPTPTLTLTLTLTLTVLKRLGPRHPREQQAAWVEQVAQLPAQKREAAFDALQRETGLGREQLGLPPEGKEEL